MYPHPKLVLLSVSSAFIGCTDSSSPFVPLVSETQILSRLFFFFSPEPVGNRLVWLFSLPAWGSCPVKFQICCSGIMCEGSGHPLIRLWTFLLLCLSAHSWIVSARKNKSEKRQIDNKFFFLSWSLLIILGFYLADHQAWKEWEWVPLHSGKYGEFPKLLGFFPIS